MKFILWLLIGASWIVGFVFAVGVMTITADLIWMVVFGHMLLHNQDIRMPEWGFILASILGICFNSYMAITLIYRIPNYLYSKLQISPNQALQPTPFGRG